MLKLRKEHLDAFEAQAINLFAARVLSHVRAVWPAECDGLGAGPVAELVHSGVQRAAALGLITEHEVARFVDLTFILGKDFETSPLAIWTRPILADRALAPAAKLTRLYQRMEEEFVLLEKRKGGGV